MEKWIFRSYNSSVDILLSNRIDFYLSIVLLYICFRSIWFG